MKKVLLVSCDGLGKGGVQSVMMNIVRQFSNEICFDILLFTDEKRYYDDEFLSYGGKIFRVPKLIGKTKLDRFFNLFRNDKNLIKKLKEIFSNEDYIAVHCNNSFNGGLILELAKKCGIKQRIIHFHTELITKSNQLLKQLIIKKQIQKIKRNATKIIECSPGLCAKVFSGDDRVECILNPYDEKQFNLSKYADRERSKELSILQVGRFNENKNQLFSLNVLREIRKKYPNVKLKFVGAGGNDYFNSIKKYVNDCKLHDNVEFFDFDAQVPELLLDSPAFIFPSFSEGFGIVLIEAQAMGVRCYASTTVPKITNCGGVAYLDLRDGESTWANKIMQDYEENTELYKEYNCEQFTSCNMINRLRKVYND